MIRELLELDDLLFLWINREWSTPALDGIMSFATVAGNSVVLIFFGLLVAAMWGGAKNRRMTIMFLLTMAIGGAALLSIKQTIPRDRPCKRFEEKIFKGQVTVHTPYNRLYHRSFPSGHTQSAFSAAGFFALYFRRRQVLLYFAASTIAISRVYLGAHFVSDIVVGAALGWFAAWLVWRLDPLSPGRAAT